MSGVKMDDELPEYERCQVDPNVCGAFIIRPLARSFAFRSALMSYVFLSEISYSGFDNIIRITSPWHVVNIYVISILMLYIVRV